MFVGHFALALGLKAKYRLMPLLYLLIGVELLDIFFVPLAILGIESAEPAFPGGENVFGGLIIHADYTHSLVGALLLTLLGATLVAIQNRNYALPMGLAVFSHWILDLIVHRPDLPILPGDRSILLGLGLWNFTGLSWAFEFALIPIFWFLYYRAAKDTIAKHLGSRASVPKSIYGTLILLMSVQIVSFFF